MTSPKQNNFTGYGSHVIVLLTNLQLAQQLRNPSDLLVCDSKWMCMIMLISHVTMRSSDNAKYLTQFAFTNTHICQV